MRRWWVLVLGVAAAWGWGTRGALLPDDIVFTRAGSALWDGRWGEVFADPTIQAGPFQLAAVRAMHALDVVRPGFGVLALSVAGLPLLVAGTGAGVRVLRRAQGLRPAPGAELVLAAVMLAWGVSEELVHTGHPAEGVAPVLWVVAAVLARRGATGRAGALIAFATGWETWGLLGLPVLLLAPDVRALARGLGACLAAGALTWLPFVATGRFRMGDYAWLVSPASIWGGSLTDGFPWTLRLLQGGLALLAATAVVAVRRRSPDVVWLAPLAAVTVRLVLDPVLYRYYWLPAIVLLVAGLGVTTLPVAGRAQLRLAALAVGLWAAVSLRTWEVTLGVGVPVVVVLVLTARLSGADAGRGRPAASDAAAPLPAAAPAG